MYALIAMKEKGGVHAAIRGGYTDGLISFLKKNYLIVKSAWQPGFRLKILQWKINRHSICLSMAVWKTMKFVKRIQKYNLFF